METLMISKQGFKNYLSMMHLRRLQDNIIPVCHTLWALWFASTSFPSLKNFAIFFVGVFVIHGLASVTSTLMQHENRKFHITTLHTVEVLALLAFIAAGLVIFTNWLTIWLAVVGLGLIVLYAYMKRSALWAPLFFAAAWAWSVPLAFAAEARMLYTLTWLLYAAIFFWLVDFKFSANFKPYNALPVAFLKASIFLLFIITGILSGQGFIYFVCLLVVLGIFVYQIKLLQQKRNYDLIRVYTLHRWIGGIMLFGVIASALLA